MARGHYGYHLFCLLAEDNVIHQKVKPAASLGRLFYTPSASRVLFCDFAAEKRSGESRANCSHFVALPLA